MTEISRGAGLFACELSALLSIDGQCQTNPWPVVPDRPYWRNADAWLTVLTSGKNTDAEVPFLGGTIHSFVFPGVQAVRIQMRDSVPAIQLQRKTQG